MPDALTFWLGSGDSQSLRKIMPKAPIDVWLREKLDGGEFADLRWLNQREGKFCIDWPHGKLKAFNARAAASCSIFAAWAEYRGASGPSHTRSYSTLKQTFRCAINGNRRIEHCPADRGPLFGSASYRVFRFVDCKFELASSVESVRTESSSSDSEMLLDQEKFIELISM